MPTTHKTKLAMTVICPGCGWTGTMSNLNLGACPSCEYENGVPPYRLFTLDEMSKVTDVEYTDIRLDLFLISLLNLLGIERE